MKILIKLTDYLSVFLCFLFIFGFVILLLFFQNGLSLSSAKDRSVFGSMVCRETDIKIKEQQHDIWILLDSETRTVIALGRSGVREQYCPYCL